MPKSAIKKFGGTIENQVSTAATSYIDPENREITYNWIIYKGAQNIWRLNAPQLAKHKKINDQWKWESLTHMGFSVEGAVIGGSITPNLISTLPYYGTTIFASQQLKYTLTFALVCKGFPLSYTTDVITSEGIFQL